MVRRLRASGTLASWRRLSQAAALSTLVNVVGVSAVGLFSSDASWLGATDDRVASVAIDTYGGFLRRVAGAIGLVAILEWVFLTVVTLGLLQLMARPLDHRPSRRLRAAGTAFAVAFFVTLVLWGFGASRHPGLFLSILAAHRGAALWAEACRFLAPLVAVASFFGLMLGAARARKAKAVAMILGVTVLASVGVMRGGLWLRRYRPATPFGTAARAPTAGWVNPLAGTASAAAAPLPPAPKEVDLSLLPPRPSSVLWIAVDSLRPDKIDAKNTPNIAALLAESIYFPNTIVPVPRTGPSWAAALTSLEPLTTGIETMFPDAKRSDLSTVAMPAYLASRSYHTMVVSEYAGEFFRRVKVGFETESVPRAELKQISGQIMMSRAPLVLAPIGLAYGSGPGLRHFLPMPMEELIAGCRISRTRRRSAKTSAASSSRIRSGLPSSSPSIRSRTSLTPRARSTRAAIASPARALRSPTGATSLATARSSPRSIGGRSRPSTARRWPRPMPPSESSSRISADRAGSTTRSSCSRPTTVRASTNARSASAMATTCAG